MPHSHKLRAHWVLPVGAPPIENGLIEIADGRIVDVRPARPHEGAEDLGRVVLMPGLVNAHTHLELTCLAEKVPFRGSFAGWIRTLMPQHPRRGSREVFTASFSEGLRASLAAGVTTIGDISGGADAVELWTASRLRAVGFLEVVGMGERRINALTDARGLIETFRSREHDVSSRTQLAITPHAPYSTDTSVYEEAIDLARRHDVRICTHLAETREEQQFLQDGTGPFRELLEEFGLWDGSFRVPGCSPVEYAEQIGLLALRPLLAHVNYVSDTDIDRLARHGASVSFCPRTHRFFEHLPHRYRDMLARGVNVCVGTDSLASNHTLSVLDELRFLRAGDDLLDDATLIEMATVRGARALGLEGQVGRLAPRYAADVIAIPLAAASEDPYDAILRSEASPSAVYIAGERLI